MFLLPPCVSIWNCMNSESGPFLRVQTSATSSFENALTLPWHRAQSSLKRWQLGRCRYAKHLLRWRGSIQCHVQPLHWDIVKNGCYFLSYFYSFFTSFLFSSFLPSSLPHFLSALPSLSSFLPSSLLFFLPNYQLVILPLLQMVFYHCI